LGSSQLTTRASSGLPSEYKVYADDVDSFFSRRFGGFSGMFRVFARISVQGMEWGYEQKHKIVYKKRLINNLIMHLNIEIDNTLGEATHSVKDYVDSGDSQ
jgi:hypothetical protein